MCRLLGRALSGPAEIFDRFAEVSAAVVMVGQLSQMLLQLSGELRFDRLGGASMQNRRRSLSTEL